jgi:hypothetical protein
VSRHLAGLRNSARKGKKAFNFKDLFLLAKAQAGPEHREVLGLLFFSAAEFNTQGGAEGNLRGRDFERAVQAIIDLSSWAPPQDLRQKVCQTIRIARKDVTDLDAIVLKDEKLLLVSCKSRIYSGKFDQGDPQAIGATASVAKNALRTWLEVKSR